MFRLAYILIALSLLSCVHKNEQIDKADLLELNLKIVNEHYEKIKKLRDEALELGYLIKSEDPWVKGEIMNDTGIIPIKLRLKGDHTDHLKEDKWSFRIKVRKGKVWNRLKEFSIHTPKARFFLAEWLYHKVLKDEGILATRYEFIKVKINGEHLGIYAIEEHFEKQLLEYQKRREGMIFKFDESELWKKRVEEGGSVNMLTTENDITIFNKGKYLSDSSYTKQFNLAKTNFEDYLSFKKKVSNVFDIEKLAKYYALTDVFQAYHGIIWHNERWYFNPIINKFEPIAFDGYATNIFDWVSRPYLGYNITGEQNSFKEPLYDGLFKDDEFKFYYNKFVKEFSNDEFIDEIKSKYSTKLDSLNKILKYEFEDYQFNFNYMDSSALAIKTNPNPVVIDEIELDSLGKFPKRFLTSEKEIIVSKDSYTLNNDIYIPKGYKLIIEKGTKIDFINNSKFISYSPVYILGAEDEKVTITSSDSSAQGFTILQADSSVFQNVVFSNFNTLISENWNLTGAVTFYESDVNFTNVIIKNAQCEDALNIVRSNFEINNLTIDKCFSDGFDADFCRGKISNSTFLNTGNDGMDFSGSYVEINNCKVTKSADKGLSVGEEATVQAYGLYVVSSNIGVASKDLSKVVLDNSRIEKCNIGLTAYIKKPEYGSATINATNVELIGNKVDEEIEKGSKLNKKN